MTADAGPLGKKQRSAPAAQMIHVIDDNSSDDIMIVEPQATAARRRRAGGSGRSSSSSSSQRDEAYARQLQLELSGSSGSGSSSSSSSSTAPRKNASTCPLCTFENHQGALRCNVCETSLTGSSSSSSSSSSSDHDDGFHLFGDPYRQHRPSAASSSSSGAAGAGAASSSSTSTQKRKRGAAGEQKEAPPPILAGMKSQVTFSEHVENKLLSSYSAPQRTLLLARILDISKNEANKYRVQHEKTAGSAVTLWSLVTNCGMYKSIHLSLQLT